MRPLVSGLVPAAGASTRPGQPARLLPFGTTTTIYTRVLNRAPAGIKNPADRMTAP